MVGVRVGNKEAILYILSVGRDLRKGGEMMTKTSVKVYFSGEANDGTKRNYSRTVNYIRDDAANADLGMFKTAFTAILGKQVSKAEKITVVSL